MPDSLRGRLCTIGRTLYRGLAFIARELFNGLAYSGIAYAPHAAWLYLEAKDQISGRPVAPGVK